MFRGPIPFKGSLVIHFFCIFFPVGLPHKKKIWFKKKKKRCKYPSKQNHTIVRPLFIPFQFGNTNSNRNMCNMGPLNSYFLFFLKKSTFWPNTLCQNTPHTLHTNCSWWCYKMCRSKIQFPGFAVQSQNMHTLNYIECSTSQSQQHAVFLLVADLFNLH